jgi:hypothetical protein
MKTVQLISLAFVSVVLAQNSLNLTKISLSFEKPIGIDYHPPSNSLILTHDFPTGIDGNFKRIDNRGKSFSFSNISGLTNEVLHNSLSNEIHSLFR